MEPARRSPVRFLPHALVATLAVTVLPSFAISAIAPTSDSLLLFLSVVAAMLLSLVLAFAGAAVWKRWPGSADLVFGDLMLWGWLRRARAERRLAEVRALIGPDGAWNDVELGAEARSDLLERLSALLEARDAYTHGHSRRVTRHSERIAREMGLPPNEVAKIRVAAAVHDVGKVRTPRAVLTKPGRLTEEEFAVIKRHPVDGADMVNGIGDPEITAMVRHHHERLDGTGYPDGLASEEIPLGARIISVADTFDAMTSNRPYRGACKHKQALDVLAREAGSQLDQSAVAAFMRYYGGNRSVAWSAFLLAAPQRLAAWLGSVFQGVGAGVAPVVQGLAAVGAAGLAGVTLAGAPADVSAHVESADGRAHESREIANRSAPLARARSSDRGVHHGRPRSEDRRARTERRASERRRALGKPGVGPQRDDGRRDGGSGGGSPGGGRSEGGSPGEPGGGGDSGGGSGGGGGSGEGTPLRGIEVPDVEVPEVDVPGVELPRVEVPGVEVPGVEVPGVQLPGVDVPGVQLPGVKLPGVKAPGI
jgi:putative nucleotidyltransferase with HDIG domain